MSNPELMDALAALAADKGVSVDTLFQALPFRDDAANRFAVFGDHDALTAFDLGHVFTQIFL